MGIGSPRILVDENSTNADGKREITRPSVMAKFRPLSVNNVAMVTIMGNIENAPHPLLIRPTTAEVAITTGMAKKWFVPLRSSKAIRMAAKGNTPPTDKSMPRDNNQRHT